MVISSASNENIRFLRQLKDKKYRDETGTFVVEGGNIVRDMPKEQIRALYVAESKYTKFENIISCTDKLFILDDKLFERVASTENSQGIIAIADKRNPIWDENSNAVILDSVCDPGNIGAIIRTAVCSGIYNIICINSADAYNEKAVRASMGGIFHCNIFSFSYEEVKTASQLKGYTLIAMDMGGENIFTMAKPKKFALIMGSEARGISEKLTEISDKTVAIPMSGKIESLNVAVSCGIAMYLLQDK